MSLILDALKRAERERRGEDAVRPPVVSMPLAGTPAPQRPWRIVAVVAAAVAALAGGAFFARFVFRDAPPPVAAAPAPTASPPKAEPILARPAPAPTVVPGTEDVASLDDLTDEPLLEDGAAAPMPKPAPAKPVVAPEGERPGKSSSVQTIPNAPTRAAEMKPTKPSAATAPVEAPAKAPVQAPAEAPAREAETQQAPAPTPAPAQQAPASAPTQQAPASAPTQQAPAPAPAQAQPPAEIPPALTQPAPLRKLREMPPDYRADFPKLNVEIHVYEPQAQRRFVMVNGRRYREGERMAEGPALVEIVPEGMVLEHRGEKVLYTLGR